MKTLKPMCGVVLALLMVIVSCTSMDSKTETVRGTNGNARLTADYQKEKTPVSRNLFGIFFEDINYAADGGLYGEMVRNRSFEYGFGHTNWIAVNAVGKSETSIEILKTEPLNESNPSYARFTSKETGEGIANNGYNGMYLEEGKTYPGSVYLRSPDGSVKSLTVSLVDVADGSVLDAVSLKGITGIWQKFEYNLTPASGTTKGRIVLRSDTVGTVEIDMVSLFYADIYKNETNGLRKDIAEMLEAMHPGFMRFPGGCIVEGLGIDNAYRWKDTIGPVEARKENGNLWGYQQSYGLGFYEYFRLCEDIGAEPVPIINCGISCQVRGAEVVPVSDLSEWIQDALDLIEFANGDISTEWGALRAEYGHPEPFGMKYLGIGNENYDTVYFEHYKPFAEAIKARYPDMKLILSSGTDPSGTMFDKAVNFYKRNKGLVDLIDEHYYRPPEWFLTNTHRYDTYNRKGQKIFAGEYAAHVPTKVNNLYAALSEAAFMTGLERNGDIVEIASYAPLFARKGSTQWTPDMIWFNSEQVYGTPDYYVQLLFSTYKTDRTISYGFDSGEMTKLQTGERAEPLYAHIGEVDCPDGGRKVIIKIVNIQDEPLSVEIDLRNFPELETEGHAVILSGSFKDENSFKAPEKVAPVQKTVPGICSEFTFTADSCSLTVLELVEKQ